MKSQILRNFLKAFKPKYQYECFICEPAIKLKNLKHLKYHNRKFHKNKVGIVFNR